MNWSRPPYRRRSSLAVVAAAAALGAGCADSMTGIEQREGPQFAESQAVDLRATLQATPPGYIRIGVVPSATQVTLGAAGAWTVVDKATDAVLFSGTDGGVTVQLETVGNVDTRFWLQTACVGVAARDAWLAAAQALGYETRTQFVPAANCYRTQLGTQNQGFSARVAFRNQAIADGLAGGDSFWTSVTIVTDETKLRVEHDGADAVLESPVVLRSANGLVSIQGRTYRGVGEVWTNGSGTLAGINEVLLEEYLYGVVPRELPPGPYGLPEAQKAQAVTARTYALANMGKRASDGYDLLPTTGDQVYGGYQDEHPVSTKAVDDTRGVVAVHNGTLITTLYHSTSGGWTANSEDVYTAAVPYLRGVPDAERGRALEKVPDVSVFMRNANPTNLRARAEGDFEADWSIYHRWTVDWTVEELATILAANLGQPITTVHAVRIVDRADQGRVLRIEFDTDAGTFGANKDGIRWVLNYYNASGVMAPLRSTLFFIEPVRDNKSKQVTGWVAYGGGWGHGVGMSQTGAVGMAERGRTYEEILQHYYRGIELETRD